MHTYKRNCYCYNFGVHDLKNDIDYFYVLDETTASRGSQELVSCLIQHLKLTARLKKKVIIVKGQNRKNKYNPRISETRSKWRNNCCVIIRKYRIPILTDTYT